MEPAYQELSWKIRFRNVYTAQQFREEILEESVSLNGVYQAMNKGQIPYTQVGRQKLIPGTYARQILGEA